MSKEYIEALEKVYYGSQGYGNCDENYKIVKQALNRLESIDNAEPSEALYELKRIDYNITYLLSDCDTIEEVSMCLNSLRDNKSCEVIKQTLLKAQKDRKALEIIKPSLRLVGNCLQAKAPFVDDDHPWVFIKEIIDEEELKLLKGVLE